MSDIDINDYPTAIIALSIEGLPPCVPVKFPDEIIIAGKKYKFDKESGINELEFSNYTNHSGHIFIPIIRECYG